MRFDLTRLPLVRAALLLFVLRRRLSPRQGAGQQEERKPPQTSHTLLPLDAKSADRVANAGPPLILLSACIDVTLSYLRRLRRAQPRRNLSNGRRSSAWPTSACARTTWTAPGSSTENTWASP